MGGSQPRARPQIQGHSPCHSLSRGSRPACAQGGRGRGGGGGGLVCAVRAPCFVAPAGHRWDRRKPGGWRRSGPGRPWCPSGWTCATGARSSLQPGRSSSECGHVWSGALPCSHCHPQAGIRVPGPRALPSFRLLQPLSPRSCPIALALWPPRALSAWAWGPEEGGEAPCCAGLRSGPADQGVQLCPLEPHQGAVLCGSDRPTACRAESQHRFWKPREVDEEVDSAEVSEVLRSRHMTFAGSFQPVQHRCRAPRPDGRLCERQDRLKVNVATWA